MKIACAQVRIGTEVDKNCCNMLKLIKAAAGQNARLVHFPEGALSGYIKTQIKDWRNVNWEELDAQIEKICEAAKIYRVWVVFGCNFRLPYPYRPHNSLFVVSDHGKIVHRYDKRNLSGSELKTWFTPGRSPVLFEVDGFKIGLATCIEINFPELFIDYMMQNSDCILCSSYSETENFKLLAQAHAALTCNWFSFSVPQNVSGVVPSFIAGPNGKIIDKCSRNRQTLAYANLKNDDPEFEIVLTRARPWRKKVRAKDFYAPHYHCDE